MDNNTVQDVRIDNIEGDIKDVKGDLGDVKKRVFNGLGKELREEIDKSLDVFRKELHESIGGVRNLVVGILITIFVGVVAAVLQGKLSADRDYKTMMELKTEIRLHTENDSKPPRVK